MSEQHEILRPMMLLDSRGRITEEGWARRPHWSYRRSDIKAPWWRIKEWDYYHVLSDDLKRGITFTISDLGYAGLMALCWIDFEKGTTTQVDALTPFTRGRVTSELTIGADGDSAAAGGVPAEGASAGRGPTGVLEYEGANLFLRFEVHGGGRRLIFRAPTLEIGGERGAEGEIELEEPNGLESMNIATSWEENRRRFYYNRKINGMPALGRVRAGGQDYDFRPESAFGGLDWGRGVWTYRNRWFWSSATGMIGGKVTGFNLGYGFSDRSPASENALFYDGKTHKLGKVRFLYDEKNYMTPWEIRDGEGRLELRFEPVVDRSSRTDFLLIKSVQHQVFGRFYGTAVLDDGKRLVISGMTGFAEDVFNRW